jgi:hypothetical protein
MLMSRSSEAVMNLISLWEHGGCLQSVQEDALG